MLGPGHGAAGPTPTPLVWSSSLFFLFFPVGWLGGLAGSQFLFFLCVPFFLRFSIPVLLALPVLVLSETHCQIVAFVPLTGALVHGPWSMDLDPWDLGPRTLVHGPWFMDHGHWTIVGEA